MRHGDTMWSLRCESRVQLVSGDVTDVYRWIVRLPGGRVASVHESDLRPAPTAPTTWDLHDAYTEQHARHLIEQHEQRQRAQASSVRVRLAGVLARTPGATPVSDAERSRANRRLNTNADPGW